MLSSARVESASSLSKLTSIGSWRTSLSSGKSMSTLIPLAADWGVVGESAGESAALLGAPVSGGKECTPFGATDASERMDMGKFRAGSVTVTVTGRSVMCGKFGGEKTKPR